ncbi:MAG: hypothetical protein MZW92_21775 [Comamonadaceae bacterium]|nr:hypothetical protein [Comamonadaceae bacterium]
MDEARHCGRVVMINAGRIVAGGTPAEIVAAVLPDRPEADLNDAFVALMRQGARMNARRIQAIARKEYFHLIRDFRSLYLAFIIPLLLILLFGYALSLDVEHIPDGGGRPRPHAGEPRLHPPPGRLGLFRRGRRTRPPTAALTGAARPQPGHPRGRHPARLERRPQGRPRQPAADRDRRQRPQHGRQHAGLHHGLHRPGQPSSLLAIF